MAANSFSLAFRHLHIDAAKKRGRKKFHIIQPKNLNYNNIIWKMHIFLVELLLKVRDKIDDYVRT